MLWFLANSHNEKESVFVDVSDRFLEIDRSGNLTEINTHHGPLVKAHCIGFVAKWQ